MGLKAIVENHPIGVGVLTLSAILTLLLNTIALYNISFPHKYYGSREFANEYIVVLVDDLKLKEAEIFFSQIYAFAEESGNSTLGLSPDELEIARSIANDDRWLIGMDRVAEQGEYQTVKSSLDRFEHRLMNLDDGNFQNLSESSKSGYEYLTVLFTDKKIAVKYYSASKYSTIYGVDLPNLN